MSFDVLQEKIIAKQNPTVAGLDARIEYVPEHIRKAAFAQYGVGLLMEEHLRNLERAEQTQSSSAAQEDGVQPEESSGFHFPW